MKFAKRTYAGSTLVWIASSTSARIRFCSSALTLAGNFFTGVTNGLVSAVSPASSSVCFSTFSSRYAGCTRLSSIPASMFSVACRICTGIFFNRAM